MAKIEHSPISLSAPCTPVTHPTFLIRVEQLPYLIPPTFVERSIYRSATMLIDRRRLGTEAVVSAAGLKGGGTTISASRGVTAIFAPPHLHTAIREPATRTYTPAHLTTLLPGGPRKNPTRTFHSRFCVPPPISSIRQYQRASGEPACPCTQTPDWHMIPRRELNVLSVRVRSASRGFSSGSVRIDIWTVQGSRCDPEDHAPLEQRMS